MTDTYDVKDFLEKDNITYLYKSICTKHQLDNLSKDDKKQVISNLTDVMKKKYKTLDLSKINKGNFIMVKKQFNDLAIKDIEGTIQPLIKTINNKQMNTVHDRKYERDFNTVKKTVAVNERPISSLNEQSYALAPSDKKDYLQTMNRNLGERLKELEEARKKDTAKPIIETPDFLKPINVGKTDIRESNTIKSERPLLGYGSNEEPGNFGSNAEAAGKSNISKYNENMSIQDRLSQLEKERQMPQTALNQTAPNQPPQSNISAFFNTDKPTENFNNMQQYQPPNKQNPEQNNMQQYQPPNKQNPEQNNMQQYQPPNKQNPEQNKQYQPDMQNMESQNNQLNQPNIQYMQQNNMQQNQQQYQPSMQNMQPSMQNMQPSMQNMQPSMQNQQQYQSSMQKQDITMPFQKIEPNNTIIDKYINNINELNEIINKMTTEINTLKKNPKNRILQLEINKVDSNYKYMFNQIDNIIGIKLISYYIPPPTYNIIYSTEFIYSIGNEIKKININKGYYTIEKLIETMNQNNDILFKLDTSLKINITCNDEFKILPNNMMKKLGFNNNTETLYKNITAENFPDIRLLTKLNLYLLNIQNDYPFGILNVNGSSICELNFINPISIDHLNLKFTSENNMDYDFNGVSYNLSFQIIIKE